MHTIDTIMTITKLRVHIAPVGFEIDRITMPAIRMKADKIWLLTHDNVKDDRAKKYEDAIKKEFQKKKIKIITMRVNRKEIFEILQSVKQIINEEHENDVYINASSGSKIQAIACMIACMMFNQNENLTPYYAEPEKYPTSKEKQQSIGLKNIIELPNYQILIPKQELIQALKIIKENNGRISKKEMARIAEQEEIIIVNAREENFEQARFASLDKNIIQPLIEKWNFIKIEKVGRTRWIKLTNDGNNAIKFLI